MTSHRRTLSLLACAVVVLSSSLTTGCAGEAGLRYQGRVLSADAPSIHEDTTTQDARPPVAGALVVIGADFAADPVTMCSRWVAAVRKPDAHKTTDAVTTGADGAFTVATYFGGLWPFPFPDTAYVCVDHPDYEPFAHASPLHEAMRLQGRVVKIELRPRPPRH